MPLDAFGLAQPSPAPPLLLGARYGSALFPIAASEVVYAEFTLPGKLWQPGYAVPYRDGRLANLQQPGVLTIPYALHCKVWGFSAGTPTIQWNIGKTVAVTQVVAAGVIGIDAWIFPQTWTTAFVYTQLVQGTTIGMTRASLTLGVGFDANQTLSVTNTGDAAVQTTLDAAMVWLLPAPQYAPDASILESLMG